LLKYLVKKSRARRGVVARLAMKPGLARSVGAGDHERSASQSEEDENRSLAFCSPDATRGVAQ